MAATSAALSVFDDPREKARQLGRLHTLWAETGTVPRGVRDVVRRAWARPAASTASVRALLPEHDVERRREAQHELMAVLPLLEARLQPVTEDAGSELVLCDAEGIVLDVRGPASVRRASERLGFVEGACWAEESVGTNALGTALVERHPVQLFGPEHSNAGHHGWVCTGVPVVDPATGGAMGAFTLSGPLVSAHPHTLTLVTAVAAEVGAEIAERRRHDVARLLRSAPRVDGPHLLLDASGRLCRASGLAGAPATVDVRPLRAGRTSWVDGVGAVDVSSWKHGWLLVPAGDEALGIVICDGAPAHVEVRTAGGSTRLRLTPRQHGLLSLLAGHPEGLSARDVADALYPGGSLVTVRAELSRLRSRLGPVVGSRPYRLTVPATFRNSSG